MHSSVLHICKVYLPVTGGVQKVVKTISHSLTEFHHTVLTTGNDGAIGKEKIASTTIIRCRSYAEIASMPLSPSLLRETLRQIRKHQLIAIHYPFPLADVAMCLAPFSPPTIVHWHSNIVAQRKLKWLVAPFSLIMLWRCKAIVITSPAMLANSSLLRLFKHKVELIPYGLSAAMPQERSPKQNGLNARKDYFLIVGRHVSYKGISIAIKALYQNSIRLVIAGDGPLFEQHQALVNELQLQNQVEFVRHASDEKVQELIQDCRALVVPSIKENEAFALVQLEAMRYKKAVINTNLNSSVPWVARHNKEALTVQAENISELRMAMEKLSENSQLCTKLGEAGFARFNTEFNQERFQESLHSLYIKLLR